MGAVAKGKGHFPGDLAPDRATFGYVRKIGYRNSDVVITINLLIPAFDRQIDTTALSIKGRLNSLIILIFSSCKTHYWGLFSKRIACFL